MSDHLGYATSFLVGGPKIKSVFFSKNTFAPRKLGSKISAPSIFVQKKIFPKIFLQNLGGGESDRFLVEKKKGIAIKEHSGVVYKIHFALKK